MRLKVTKKNPEELRQELVQQLLDSKDYVNDCSSFHQDVYGWCKQVHYGLEQIKSEGLQGVRIVVRYVHGVYDWDFIVKDKELLRGELKECETI
jgi:hypothetical protein